MKILITSAGRRVSLVRSFQKELKKIDPTGQVFTTDLNPSLSSACQISDGFFKSPRLDDSNYIETLIKFCKSYHISMVVPTIDTELLALAMNKARFAKHGINIIISSVEFVNICRNKREMHKFFENHNIVVAKEYTRHDYKLPIFIKPTDGSRSIDTYLIKTEDEFREYHFKNENLMFLEYLDPKEYDEFTCDLYYGKDHKLKCVVPRKRIEVRDGEVSKALTVNNQLVSYINKNLNYINGAVGCLTSQFFLHKTDPDKIYAIEINPRFGGGYPLTYLSGANYSKWLIEEYLLHQTIEDNFDVWENNLLMIRYDDQILVHDYKG